MPDDAVVADSRVRYFHDRFLTAAACALCVTAQQKIFEIQYLEIIYAADIVLLSLFVLLRPHPVRLARPLFRVAMGWLIFCVLVVLLGALSLRQDFFAEGATTLKQPLVVTIARIAEIVLDVFALVYLANRFIKDKALCSFALRCFCLVGIAGCVFGLVSVFAFFTLHIRPGGSSLSGRLVGFNNEPGPFGAYLVSVLFALLAARGRHLLSAWQFRPAMAIWVISFALTLSGAGVVTLAACLFLIVLFRATPLRAALACASLLVAGALIFSLLGLQSRVETYINAARLYPRLSKISPTNMNLVAGRIAGIYLAPQMIANHPLAGIGMGNYPIIRDDPQYRNGSPIVAIAVDAPSLGLIDYLVDLGIPLSLFLVWIQISPVFPMVRGGASTAVLGLTLVLPTTVWFSAHLNITYPWISAAMGMGLFYGEAPAKNSRARPSLEAEAAGQPG